MGDWMSGRYASSNPYWGFLGIAFIILVGLVVVGIGGFVYFQLYPESTTTKKRVRQTFQIDKDTLPIDSVLKTLNEDEKKVLDVLLSHEGKYLQKYIRKEAELTRLKTHRVVARLAERGIVTLKKTGNTNEVQIADWLEMT